MPFTFKELEIPGLHVVTPKIFSDERGFFLETFKESDFVHSGLRSPVKQVNHSKSRKGVLRGLHFQLNPEAQMKMVSVVEGEIFDAAVDLRKGSPCYGKWVGRRLNDRDKEMLYIPEGFAHGFCVLSQSAQVIYYCSREYSPEHERGLRWNAPEIAIQWPVENPIVCERDANYPGLSNLESNFTYNGT